MSPLALAKIPGAIRLMQRKNGRMVYIVEGRDNLVHVSITLHIKGDLIATICMEDDGSPCVMEWA